jgi:acetylornithine deacetylase/succinyl-diaminopimelate desuccinylase-like protein
MINDVNNLLLEVDDKLDDLIELHQNLIKIQSVNSGYMPTGNETEVTKFCSDWLKKYKISSNVFF